MYEDKDLDENGRYIPGTWADERDGMTVKEKDEWEEREITRMAKELYVATLVKVGLRQ